MPRRILSFWLPRYSFFFPLALLTLLPLSCAAQKDAPEITLEGAAPTQQHGSTGEDKKSASAYGHVLGSNWGGQAGDFAEYAFTASAAIAPAHLTVRYARETRATARLDVTLDGKSAGSLEFPATGGWGDTEGQYREVVLALPTLSAGPHRLRLNVPSAPALPTALRTLPPVPVLEQVGNRSDKNTVGHGKNVALYTGTPSRFFYATQNMTDVFSAADGQTVRWFPDYVLVTPGSSTANNVNVDRLDINAGAAANQAAPVAAGDGVFEQRQVCVTQDDVAVSRIYLTNPGKAAVTHRITISGDCRDSADYRGNAGGEKLTRRIGNLVLLTDKNVFPTTLQTA